MALIEDSYECIKKLKTFPEYYEKWAAIRTVWAPRLNVGPVSQKEDFTPHNHANHTLGIYQILSDILIPPQAYDNEINAENLFVLNVAVILHDMMMAYKPNTRYEHSQAAHDYIMTKFRKEESFNITTPEREAIAGVVLGHSDIKDSSGKEVMHETISLLPQNTEAFPTGKLGKINTLLLAALLRLADELDIHSGRIEMYNFKDRDIKISSATHWRQCEILNFPQKKKDDVLVIQLVPNANIIFADGNIDNDIELLLKVRSKIFKELTYLNDKVFRRGFLSNWHYNNIEFYAVGELFDRLRDAADTGANLFSSDDKSVIGTLSNDPVVKNEAGNHTNKNAAIETSISIAPEDIQKKLYNWVAEKSLLNSGHYKVDKEFRVRDWIDSQALLEDGKCLDYLCAAFTQKLDISNQKYFFVGVDHYGLLIASVLGVKTGNPFSYLISKRLSDDHIEKEKEITIPEGHAIILITDVIITFRTIVSCIEFIMSCPSVTKDRINGVFSIFLRDQTNETGKIISTDSLIIEGLIDKLYVLNRDFPVERCNKDKCLFIAQGRDMYSNVTKTV